MLGLQKQRPSRSLPNGMTAGAFHGNAGQVRAKAKAKAEKAKKAKAKTQTQGGSEENPAAKPQGEVINY